MTATAHDVARYIVERKAPLSAMKLQKLLYYSQAWSLVLDDAPLFKEEIQAWAYGPVVPDIYAHHRNEFSVSSWPLGDASNLNEVQVDTIEKVLSFYGDKSAQWLSDLTHAEDPWREARRGLAPNDRSSRPITLAAMAEFYGSLSADE